MHVLPDVHILNGKNISGSV